MAALLISFLAYFLPLSTLLLAPILEDRYAGDKPEAFRFRYRATLVFLGLIIAFVAYKFQQTAIFSSAILLILLVASFITASWLKRELNGHDNDRLIDMYTGGSLVYSSIVAMAVFVTVSGYTCLAANVGQVGEVSPGSVAALAGVKAGDRILEINGNSFKDWQLPIANLPTTLESVSINLLVQSPDQAARLLTTNLVPSNQSLMSVLGVLPITLAHEMTAKLVMDETTKLLLNGVTQFFHISNSSYFSASSSYSELQISFAATVSIMFAFGLLITSIGAANLIASFVLQRFRSPVLLKTEGSRLTNGNIKIEL